MIKSPKKNSLSLESDPLLDDLLLGIEADAAVETIQQPREEGVLSFRHSPHTKGDGFVLLRPSCDRSSAETMLDRPPLHPSELETSLDLAEEGKATEVTPPLSEEEARKRLLAAKAASASYKRPDFLSRSASRRVSIPTSDVVTEILKKAAEIKKKSAQAKEAPRDEAAATIHGIPGFFTDLTKCAEPPQPPPLFQPPQAPFDADASLGLIAFLSVHAQKREFWLWFAVIKSAILVLLGFLFLI